MSITRLNPEYTPKNYWDGFTHVGSQEWGVQTGTFVNGLDAANNSSMAFRRDCPSAGKLSLVLDGTVYVEEGNNRVLDARDFGNLLVYKGYVTGNFNDLTTSAIYYTSNGMTANKPTSSAIYGYIVVIAFSNQVITQIVFNMGEVWFRAKFGAPLSWSAWKRVTLA